MKRRIQLVTLAILLVASAAIGVGLYVTPIPEPAGPEKRIGIAVSLDPAAEVKLGQSFKISLTVENKSDREVPIRPIDGLDSGTVVLSVEYRAAGTPREKPADESFRFSFTHNRDEAAAISLEPHGTKTFELVELPAVRTGTYSFRATYVWGRTSKTERSETDNPRHLAVVAGSSDAGAPGELSMILHMKAPGDRKFEFRTRCLPRGGLAAAWHVLRAARTAAAPLEGRSMTAGFAAGLPALAVGTPAKEMDFTLDPDPGVVTLPDGAMQEIVDRVAEGNQIVALRAGRSGTAINRDRFAILLDASSGSSLEGFVPFALLTGGDDAAREFALPYAQTVTRLASSSLPPLPATGWLRGRVAEVLRDAAALSSLLPPELVIEKVEFDPPK